MSTIYLDYKIHESKREIPSVDLWYPRLEGNAKEIMVGLSDVRAADSLLISYDFERDGCWWAGDCYKLRLDEVTHWMPLPEGPR